MKMILAMRHEVLPATLHVDEPSPHVDWSAGSMALLTEARPWPVNGRVRRAGVSSFGISGTNAHVIIEAPPTVEAAERAAEPPIVPWVVSAKSAAALGQQAARLGEFIGAREQLATADVGWSLAGRSTFEHRAVVLGADRQELLSGLAELADGLPGGSVISGRAAPAGKTVFVFPGQGSQWLGMGMGLHAAYPVFAEAFNTVVGELDRHLLRPLREVMWGHDENLLNTTEFAQPALFAIEVALYRLLESWGVRPDFVMGHSVGELTAAHVAGALSLENAAVLVVARGRFMQALPAGGAMMAVQATEDEVRPLLTDGVGIAAVNGPSSVVVSGDEQAVAAIADAAARTGPPCAQARGLARVPLSVDGADDRRVQNGSQGTHGQRAHHPDHLECDRAIGRADFASADYWTQHIRAAVRFADSIRFANSAGASRFLEVGPGGGLTSSIEESLAEARHRVACRCCAKTGPNRPA